jgi:hypothetical protein
MGFEHKFSSFARSFQYFRLISILCNHFKLHAFNVVLYNSFATENAQTDIDLQISNLNLLYLISECSIAFIIIFFTDHRMFLEILSCSILTHITNLHNQKFSLLREVPYSEFYGKFWYFSSFFSHFLCEENSSLIYIPITQNLLIHCIKVCGNFVGEKLQTRSSSGLSAN